MSSDISAAKSIDLLFSKTKALILLKKLPLFRGLFNHEFDVLLGICKLHSFLQNDCIFEEGDGATSLFVILSGTIEFSTQQKGVINLLTEGDVFGEMGVITQNNRAANAYCLENKTVVLEIAKSDFDLLLGKAPRVSYILMKNMAAELAERFLQVNKDSFSLRSNTAPQVKNISMRYGQDDQVIKIFPSKNDEAITTHFKINKMTNGQLFFIDGQEKIQVGDFVPLDMAQEGLIFKPRNAGVKKCWFDVEASSDAETVLSGSEKTRVHIFIYHVSD